MKHIQKCMKCGVYGLQTSCKCGGATAIPKPAKYSPEDSYGSYRRKVKHDMLKEKGLL